MTQPITIRFATETASAKAGMQDLAAAVVSNMVKVSAGVDRIRGAMDGSVAQSNAAFGLFEKHGTAFKSLADNSGGYAAAFKEVASTVANDSAKIGHATWKAANDHNFALSAMGIAAIDTARKTQTGAAAMSAAWTIQSAPIAAKLAFLRNEIAGVWNSLAASPIMMGGVAAVAGILVVSSALSVVEKLAAAARERLDGMMKVVDGAEGAGVGTSFFQRWLGEAKALNLETDKLQGMLNRAREASTRHVGEGDQGSSSPIGGRIRQNVMAGNLGQGDADRFNAAKGQEDRIRVVLDLIEQLRTKGMDLAAFDLANKMFGSDFETKLRNGVDMVGQMRSVLDSMRGTDATGNRVLTPEELEQAKLLKATLDETDRILRDAVAPISKDIAAYQAQQSQAAAEFSKNLAEAYAWALRLYGPIKAIGDALTSIGTWKGWDSLSNVLPRINTDAVVDIDPSAPKPGSAPTQLPAITVPGDRSKSLPSLSGRKPKAASSDTDGIEAFLRNLEKANGLAQVELDMIGKSNVERAIATEMVKAKAAAQKEGRDLTGEEEAKIRRLAEATQVLKDRTVDLQQQLRLNAEAMRSFGEMGVNALADMVIEGKSADEVFKNLAKTLARQALTGMLLGTGPFAGIFGTAAPASGGANAIGGLLGSLVGGSGSGGLAGGWMPSFRANGGPVQAGRAYTVGEVGQELFIPDADGRMVPIARGGAGGGAAGGPTVNVHNYAGGAVEVGTGQGADGSMEITVRALESKLANRMMRGQGALAPLAGRQRTAMGRG